jgi:hypothetical protein
MIEIKTEDPRILVSKINEAIRGGQIITWILDEDGDYTHSLDQWRNKAWLRCSYDEYDETLLRFIIIEPRTLKLSKAVYGVYHGRFAEMLLTHFDSYIISLSISPLLTKYDIFSKGQ